ncbi:MAG: hypothetical protein P4L83_18910 [Nevskia sp.]|nr:hypothetical protein [Nevskia sp.]
MAHADGIAFVPSYPDFLAVCNYSSDTINFYRLNPGAASHFAVQPQVIFTSPYLRGPDGIAFSACGMLATANHSTDTLSIFRQVHGVAACAAPIYDPMPIAVIRDSTLRYPHSVAFCPETNHLAVTNSGSPYVNVYAATGTTPQADWSQACAATIPFVPPSVFEPINSANEQEGGPKGVAVSAREIAVCSPQMGIRVYAYGAARPMSL